MTSLTITPYTTTMSSSTSSYTTTMSSSTSSSTPAVSSAAQKQITDPDKIKTVKERMEKSLKSDPRWSDKVSESDKDKLKLHSPYEKSILSYNEERDSGDLPGYSVWYLDKDHVVRQGKLSLIPTLEPPRWHHRNGYDVSSPSKEDVIKYIVQPHTTT